MSKRGRNVQSITSANLSLVEMGMSTLRLSLSESLLVVKILRISTLILAKLSSSYTIIY